MYLVQISEFIGLNQKILIISAGLATHYFVLLEKVVIFCHRNLVLKNIFDLHIFILYKAK